MWDVCLYFMRSDTWNETRTTYKTQTIRSRGGRVGGGGGWVTVPRGHIVCVLCGPCWRWYARSIRPESPECTEIASTNADSESGQSCAEQNCSVIDLHPSRIQPHITYVHALTLSYIHAHTRARLQRASRNYTSLAEAQAVLTSNLTALCCTTYSFLNINIPASSDKSPS